ncbi:putative methyltransferase-domain-containing protein [Aspergillus ambiguus]|uniref:protein N-lysine methyltransferase family protein n=1 Tax=Aspergillus ambiguus TaxID=176160 RepID=UPI003CCE0235
MVYYVRFLKTPRFQKQKPNVVTVSALLCVTTDLGDAFLAQDVDLLVSLTLHKTEKVIYQEPVKWRAGKREVAISLGPFPSQLLQKAIVLSVTAGDVRKPSAPSPDRLSGQASVPLVVSGYSAPFGGSEPLISEKLVERRFAPNDKLQLKIWEETGNSIARHIWDAALASVIYLQHIVSGDPIWTVPLLQNLLQTDRSAPLRAIELGSGCGIVGIALAQLLPQASILLTDLPEVAEIVTQNISVSALARSSTLDFQTLDWDEELPNDLHSGPIDLILVSDCTYNADSLPALISVLTKLVQSSPDAVVLVALKRRHESESIFFDLMQSAGLVDLHTDYMQLPSQHDQVDQIELHCYGRAERRPGRPKEPLATP